MVDGLLFCHHQSNNSRTIQPPLVSSEVQRLSQVKEGCHSLCTVKPDASTEYPTKYTPSSLIIITLKYISKNVGTNNKDCLIPRSLLLIWSQERML